VTCLTMLRLAIPERPLLLILSPNTDCPSENTSEGATAGPEKGRHTLCPQQIPVRQGLYLRLIRLHDASDAGCSLLTQQSPAMVQAPAVSRRACESREAPNEIAWGAAGGTSSGGIF
jgi:hypothetical protein